VTPVFSLLDFLGVCQHFNGSVAFYIPKPWLFDKKCPWKDSFMHISLPHHSHYKWLQDVTAYCMWRRRTDANRAYNFLNAPSKSSRFVLAHNSRL